MACHPRSYDRGQQIEDPAHIKDLVERKAAAHAQRGMSRLTQAAPASQALLIQAGERGENLGAITSALLRLVDRYGAAEVQTAIETALARQVPHPNAVRLALEQQREARNLPPPVASCLPGHVLAKDVNVQPHKLASYDELTTPTDSKGEQDES